MHKFVRAFTVAVVGAAVLSLAACQSEPPAKPVHHAPPPPPPAVPVNSHQSLSSDALFGFGKADLQSGAPHSELDALVDKLRAAKQINSVQLVGYTDRVGNADYNQKLSEKRAEAVRDYLVAHGVPAGVIHTEGRGEAEPIAECPHLKGSHLMTCLAPNRRVEVDYTVLQ